MLGFPFNDGPTPTCNLGHLKDPICWDEWSVKVFIDVSWQRLGHKANGHLSARQRSFLFIHL
jgi:hypothetical protein